jgi:hypothetical protein
LRQTGEFSLRYISLSIDRARVHRQRRIWRDLEIFTGVTGCDPYNYRQVCIPQAYRNLSQWAVGEGLGRETIVMQDDVWLPHGPGFDRWFAQYSAPLVVLGHTESNGGVAPKAFAADPEIWVMLSEVWTGEGRIIPAWMPIVSEYGLVLDVTRGLGG